MSRFDDIAAELESCTNLIGEESLAEVEKAFGVPIGTELRRYILEYGYIAYEYVELYGVNSNQGLDSDMVKQTAYLHEYFPVTAEYIALGGDGEVGYTLVDSEDHVYDFDPDSSKPEPTGLQLFDSIVKCYEEVKEG